MQPSVSEQQARQVEQELINQIIRFFKLFGLIAVVWFVGYLGFSVTWLLVAVLAYVVTSYVKEQRKARTKACQAVARDERQYLANLDSLPSWVFFPDVERAEWLNSIIKQSWPFVKDYAVNLINDQIFPGVRDNLPNMIKSIAFSRLDLGDIAPRVGGIKTYTGSSISRSEIVMDVDLIYYGDANIELKLGGVKAGIRSIELRGTMRVVIGPLIPRVPIAACVSVTFLSMPYLNFDLTNLGNLFDVPGIRQILVKLVGDQIAALIVVPNRFRVELVNALDFTSMRWPLPQGVLRFKVVEARDLKRSDVALFRSGKSDPYAVITVGSNQFTTKVIDNSLNPVWNETFESTVEVQQGQLMEVELFDKDPGSKDDPLGSTRIDLSSVAREGVVDIWLRLEDVDTGSVRLRLCWANLLDTAAFQAPSSSGSGGGDFSRAFLYVGVDSCRSLPAVKGCQEPSALVEVSVIGGGNDVVQCTKIVQESPNPIFEAPLHFFVTEPSVESVLVKVLHKGKHRLGQVQIPLRFLLQETGMQLNRSWELDTGSGASAQIVLFMALHAIVEGKAQAPTQQQPPAQPKQQAPAPAPTSSPEPAAAATTSSADVSPAAATGIRQRRNLVGNESELAPPSPTSTNLSSTSSLSLSPTGQLGRIKLTLRYSQAQQNLVAVCHQAELFIFESASSNSNPDLFAKLYIETTDSRISSKKQKTKTMKSSRQPVYDESFEFSLPESELPISWLCVLLQKPSSKLIGGKNHTVAMTRISLADFKQNATSWFELVTAGAAAAAGED